MSSKQINSTSSQCAVCFKKTTKSCSACGKVFYCGTEHQKQDRKQHKLDCFPAAWVAAKKPSSVSDTQLQLIATRNIEKGDLILKEKAIASVPLENSSKENKCIACEKSIETGNGYPCAGFLWAFCSESCAGTSEHISQCRLLTPKATREDSNKIVTSDIISSCCESITKDDPKSFEQVCKLGKEMLNLEVNVLSLYDLLTVFYKNPCVNNEISHLFPNASLLSHNCLPNARILISKDSKATLFLKAIWPIKKGQVISISYESAEHLYPISLMGFLQRQEFLQSRFNFQCCCLRCNDVTDLGTFSSAVKCNGDNCTQGYFLPNGKIPTVKKGGKLVCNKCGKTCNSDEISEKLETIKQKTDSVEGISDVECLLGEYENTLLASNHYLLNQLRFLGSQTIITKMKETSENRGKSNAKDIIEKLYGYISKLLAFSDIISPGLSLLNEKVYDLLASICCELSAMYADEGNLLKYVVKMKENQKYTEELLKFQHYLYSENTSLEWDHRGMKDPSAGTFINLDEYFGKEPKCAVCSKPSPISDENSCSSCKSVFYCSTKHRKVHSRQHLNEEQCFPVIITEDSTQGRFLVATRDIEKDELILKEKAIISSPSSVGGAQCNRICLGCYRSVKTSYTCSKCGWPLCDIQCENSAQHATKECVIFAANSVAPVTKNYQYEFVKALRCLLLRDTDKVKWNQILSLESHAGPRKKRPVRLQLSFEAINFIRTKCNLTQFQPDIIDHVVGVNAVNAFGLQLDGGAKGGIRTGSYLFYKTCMMSHSCNPNSTSKYGLPSLDPATKALLNTDDYNVCIYANKPIRRGESVTTTYVDLSKSTMDRQRLLYDGYFFCCSCQRCADPVELPSLMNML